MKTRSMRIMTFLFPLIALLVAGGIVRHQYARRDRLAKQIVTMDREIARLEKQIPRSQRGAPHAESHHDHED